jgi:DNA integrity scanning protein DisA with diadenylate cyclase activity
MLNTLIELAKKLAKDAKTDKIVVITKKDVEFEDDEFSFIVAPKRFVTMLESMFYTIAEEELSGKDIFERALTFLQVSEITPLQMYLRGVDLRGGAVGVLDLDILKGVMLIDLERSKLQRALEECSERVNPNVLKAVLNVAINIAHKGREGKKIGTGFVIGDVDEVLKRSRQLVINPYECHNIEEKDIKNPSNWESVMEFAQLDGVFVLDEDGIIVAAGRYLEVSVKDLKIAKGFGARHLACAAITRETEAIAVVVSESGDIRVYKDGEEILVIDSTIL